MLAARSRIPGIALVEVELREAALRKCLRNALVQIVRKFRCPRAGGRNGLRIRNLLAVEEIAPGDGRDAQAGRQPEQTRLRAVIRPSSTVA
jgi:hypothetical protein